jgi:hypothetical protein
MVQDQLTDYIYSQLKLGVSRDAIKSALVSAGWVAADVEDSLKKVGGSSSGPAVITPSASTFSAGAAGAASVGAKPGVEPQMIKVSDLVSSPSSSMGPTSLSGVSKPVQMGASTLNSAAKTSPAFSAGSSLSSNSKKNNDAMNTFVAAQQPMFAAKKRGVGVTEIIAIILVLVFGAGAWYFYAQNSTLAAKVASFNTQGDSVTAQLAALQSQVDASTTALTTQVASLTAANADLALNLSFYAVPPGSSASANPISFTISGSLSGGGKAPYALTTPRGVKVFVSNSSEAQIAAQLKPLIGDTVQLTGTYIPGFSNITVTSVTDLSVPPATSSASSSDASSTSSSTPQ